MWFGRSALEPARASNYWHQRGNLFMAVELRQSFPVSDAARGLQGNDLSQPTLAPWSKLNWAVFLPLLFVGNVVVATLAWFVVELVMR
jgi:hypothetical protein